MADRAILAVSIIDAGDYFRGHDVSPTSGADDEM